jgi:Fe-S cluster assembly protein SufB
MGESDLKALRTDYAERYGFHDPEQYVFKSRPGLDRSIVEEISWMKREPDWMREFRLRALDIFERKPLPTWGGDLSEIDFDQIFYYVKASEQQRDWDDVPQYIKNTFDKLGIPEAERKFLAGVGAQYESEVVYHNIQKSLEDQGVIFLDTDSALRETTSSQHSTAPSGRAGPSSTSRRVCGWRCRCRLTSASMPRTLGSLSGL